MTNPHHLRLVSDPPPQLPAEAEALAVRTAMGEVITLVDRLIGEGLTEKLSGESLVTLHQATADLAACLATLSTHLADRVNLWIWQHGTKGEWGGAVAEIDGELYQATMTGGPSRSLKVPEAVELGHAIFERAVTETIRRVGLDPKDDNDSLVAQLKLFGSVLDALIVGRADTPAAARLVPQKRVLAAGLVDRETGEITPPPEGQIRWALDVTNYETPTSGVRRRSFTKARRTTTTPEEHDDA